jgi:hypothetical protein
MLYFIITIIVIIIAKFLYDKAQLNEKLGKEGGMRQKYKELISFLLSIDENFKLAQASKDSIQITNISLGGVTTFELLQTFSKVSITWRFENEIFGKHKLHWEFPEYMDQTKMFENISSTLEKYQKNIVESNPLINHINSDRNKLEESESIESELKRIEVTILNELVKSCNYFELTNLGKELANRYLLFVAQFIAPAIIMHKYQRNGHEIKSEIYEILISVAYEKAQVFCQKNVTTGLIDTSYDSTFNEKLLLLFVRVKFEEYVNDLYDLMVNNNDFFEEKIEDEEGYYLHRINHKFIQDVHEVLYTEVNTSIKIKWHHEDFYEDMFGAITKDDRILSTLRVIKSLSK